MIDGTKRAREKEKERKKCERMKQKKNRLIGHSNKNNMLYMSVAMILYSEKYINYELTCVFVAYFLALCVSLLFPTCACDNKLSLPAHWHISKKKKRKRRNKSLNKQAIS